MAARAETSRTIETDSCNKHQQQQKANQIEQVRDGFVKLLAVTILTQQLTFAPPIQAALEDPSDALAGALQAFTEGRTDDLLNHFADDFVFNSVGTPSLPYSGEYKGKDAIVRFLGKFGEVFDYKLLNAEFSGDPKRNIASVFFTWEDSNKETGEKHLDECILWEHLNGEGKADRATEVCNVLAQFESLKR